MEKVVEISNEAY